MFRRIVFLLVVVIAGGAITYSYLYFKQKKQPLSNAINAIPNSAALIIESKQITETWGKLSETNVIWEGLLGTAYVFEINNTLVFLDSIRKKDAGFNHLIQKQPLFISAHMSGANTFNFLFVISTPAAFDEQLLHRFVEKYSDNKLKKNKIYDGIPIISIKSSAAGKTFHYTYFEGTLVGSHSMILVEDAIRQMKSKNSLINKSDFNKVMHTAGNKIDANLYLNYKVFPNIISTFLNPEYAEGIESITDLANWTEIDLDIKPNAIALNGYTYSNDSVNNYMNVFRNQNPKKIEMINILPENTAALIHFGYSDFGQFQKDYKTYLEKNNMLFEKGAAIKNIDIKYGCNLERDFLSWIKNEVALVITEPSSSEFENNSFLVIGTEDMDLALEKLKILDSLTNNFKGEPTDTISYKGHFISKLNITDLIKVLFGKPFQIITGNYYTTIENYVVFGNEPDNLKDFINSYDKGKTLKKNLSFDAFNSNLQDKSNIFIYSNISRMEYILKALANSEVAKDITKHAEVFRKFEGVAIQISKDKNNLYYNNVFINYNPIYKKMNVSLWETKLDTSISSKPWLVTNHYTDAKEIFVQDDGNKIYLISNTGKILWKRQLSHSVKSDVVQIDMYKNNKLQLIFNTDTSIYLIDRNGKNVEGFPIYLKTKPSAPLAVMDYEHNRNYRLLLPLSDGNVNNYEVSGKKVVGWEFKKSKHPIVQAFQHILIDNKDYLISIDESGKIHTLDRRGQERLNLKETLIGSSCIFAQKAKGLDKSYLLSADSEGIKKVFLNDKKVEESIKTPASGYLFSLYDINNDQTKDYLFIDQRVLRIMDPDNNELLTFQFDSNITWPPTTFILPENRIETGVVSTKTNEIFLINESGALHEGFPLYGSTPFSIGDINKDGKLELVVGSKDGTVYAYILE